MSAEDKKVDSHSFCIVIFLFTGILETLKKLYDYVIILRETD